MKVVFTFLAILLSAFVFANNIQLQKVSLTDTNRTAKTVNIKMNLSWEHSWRDSINWDAAWIIIKYKEPKDSAWKWKHAQLVQSGNNTGTTTGVKIVVPDDLTGAFFYRSAIGSGNIASDNIKLVWNYGTAGVTNIDSVEVRVFATEMVYVPQGSYCLGDGNGTTQSNYSFQLKNAPNSYAVINNNWSPLINTATGSFGIGIGDDAVLTNGIRISGLNGIDINNDKISDIPNFPTGYRSYYEMKYKVTQGQYADFLNTVPANDTTTTALDAYLNTVNNQYYDNTKLKSVPKPLKGVWATLGDYLTSSPTDLQRHTIVFDSIQIKFTVSRPDRAYSLMNLNKSLAFAEWFCLRPMSELEFEKSCRGPLPPSADITNRPDKAWGPETDYPVAELYSSTPFTLSGPENGTEYFTDYNVSRRHFDPVGRGNGPGSPITPGATGGDGGLGPYRVGIFATENSSRVSAQASYYGVMDLSKISAEIVVPLSTSSTRLFNYSVNGKGNLSPIGSNYSFTTLNVVSSTFYRYGIVSLRGSSNSGGFRAVRSAPSDN